MLFLEFTLAYENKPILVNVGNIVSIAGEEATGSCFIELTTRAIKVKSSYTEVIAYMEEHI